MANHHCSIAIPDCSRQRSVEGLADFMDIEIRYEMLSVRKLRFGNKSLCRLLFISTSFYYVFGKSMLLILFLSLVPMHSSEALFILVGL